MGVWDENQGQVDEQDVFRAIKYLEAISSLPTSKQKQLRLRLWFLRRRDRFIQVVMSVGLIYLASVKVRAAVWKSVVMGGELSLIALAILVFSCLVSFLMLREAVSGV